MTAATVRATERRPVRVVIEGEAYYPIPGDPTQIIVRPDGGKIVLPSHAQGVTVEDIAPPRVWTDGDVIAVQLLSGWWSAVRTNDGEWWTTAQAQRPDREHKPWGTDVTVSDIVQRGTALVLRYQAGDL